MITLDSLAVALEIKLQTSTKRRAVMSGETAQYVRRYVESFLASIKETDLLTSLALRNALRAWLHRLELAPSTQQLAAMVVASFLYEERAITDDDRNYILGKFRAEPPDWSTKALAANELERVFAEIASRPLNATRDLYVTFLMTALGLRISQATEIPLAGTGIYGEELRLQIASKKSAFGKGGVTRRVLPADLQLAGCLYSAGELHTEYLKVRPNKGTALFVGRFGDPITTVYYRSLYREIGGKLGIHLHPHRFRHTCGTVITRSAGIAQAAAVLGHSSVSTTQRYVDRSQFDYAAIIAQSFSQGALHGNANTL